MSSDVDDGEVDRFRIDFGFLSTSTKPTMMNVTTFVDATAFNKSRCVVYANFDHDVPVLVICLLSLVGGFVYSFFGKNFYIIVIKSVFCPLHICIFQVTSTYHILHINFQQSLYYLFLSIHFVFNCIHT